MAIGDLSKLPSEFFEATTFEKGGHHDTVTSYSPFSEQKPALNSDGTTHVDPTKLAKSIIDFDQAESELPKMYETMRSHQQKASQSDAAASSQITYQTSIQDLVVQQKRIQRSLRDLGKRDLDGVDEVKSNLSRQGWLDEKVNSILTLIQDGVNEAKYRAIGDEEVQE